MALTIQKTYTDKQGQEQTLKYPKMKVIGALINDEENHRFTVLKPLDTRTHNAIVEGTEKTIESTTIFVKTIPGDEAIVLELGTQAAALIKSLNPQPPDQLMISKGELYNGKATVKIQVFKTEPTVQVTLPVNEASPNTINVTPTTTANQNSVQTIVASSSTVQQQEPVGTFNVEVTEFHQSYIEKYGGSTQKSLNHALLVWYMIRHPEEMLSVSAMLKELGL